MFFFMLRETNEKPGLHNVDAPMAAINLNTGKRLRYSVSLVQQGKNQFYTLTVPTNVLSRTCVVSTRAEDPQTGFQRDLDGESAGDCGILK